MELIRYVTLAEEILFLDGISGTGKTLMAPLLNTFDRVLLGRFEYIRECICVLSHLKKIEGEVSDQLLNIYADLTSYEAFIGRSSNYRWNDLSSAFNNPFVWKNIKRLFRPDGKQVVTEMAESRPISHVVTHQLGGVLDVAFRAYQNRLRVIEMVRHPLFVIENWRYFMHMAAKDPRNFTIWFNYEGKPVPWWAQSWEEEFLGENDMDKAIHVLDWLTREMDATLDKLEEPWHQQVLIIPFETFVLNPFPWIESIEKLLNTERTSKTLKELKKQKCPRKLVADGPGKKIYQRYGWSKPKSKSDREEYYKKVEIVEKEASQSAMEKLNKLSKDYEEKHGLWF